MSTLSTLSNLSNLVKWARLGAGAQKGTVSQLSKGCKMQSVVGENESQLGDDSIGNGVKNWDTQKLNVL